MSLLLVDAFVCFAYPWCGAQSRSPVNTQEESGSPHIVLIPPVLPFCFLDFTALI